MELNQPIPKYPYNGKAKNLIDKFMILGYEPNTLKKIVPELIHKTKEKKTLFYYNCTNDSHNLFTEIQIGESIDILSEIVNDVEKELLPNDYIINSIFPEAPHIFLEIPCEASALQMNIVFSGDAIKDDSKNSFNCYAYIYYEKFKYDSKNYCYPPKALVFLSEYPFFTSFYQISIQIENMIATYRDIPIEIIIQNLISYTPSPINYSYSLQLQNQESTDSLLTFEQLSGYPLLQFNLSVLFSILPTHIIIKIFLFSFLENEILVFSDNLEILNIVLYVFVQLNYPVNVMHYYWQSGSTSLNNYLEGDSLLATKIYSSMQGINCLYDNNINTTKNSHEHFIVDLENKIFLHKYDEKYPKYARLAEENKAVLRYIDQIIANSSTIEEKESPLSSAIKILYTDLELISKKIIHGNVKSYGFPNFFKDSETIQQQNKHIQQLFYVFIARAISMLKTFNKFSTNPTYIKKTDQDKTITINQNLQEPNNYYTIIYEISDIFAPEEKLFIKNLENSSKNVLFKDIINKSQMFIDLYQIGNIFFDELTNWCVLDKKRIKFIQSPFDGIDFIYHQDKIETMNFIPFYNKYAKEWKKKLHPHFKQTSVYKSSSLKKFCFSYQGKLFDINYDILKTYMNFLENTLEEEILEVFPMKQTINKNNFQEINSVYIQNSITNNLIQQNELNKEDIIYLSLLSVFSISIKCDYFTITERQLCLILSSFRQCNVNKQKYVAFILRVLYNRLSNKERRKEKRVAFSDLNCFDILIQILLLSNEIIPNDELLDLMNSCYCQKDEIEEMFPKEIENNPKDNNTDTLNETKLVSYFSNEDFELIEKDGELPTSTPSINITNKKQTNKVSTSSSIKVEKDPVYVITYDMTLVNTIKEDKLVSTNNNIMFDGDWLFKKNFTTAIQLKFEKGSCVIRSVFYSLRKTYRLLTEIMGKEDIDKTEFKDALVNLLSYFIKTETNNQEKEKFSSFLCKLIYYLHTGILEIGEDKQILKMFIGIIFC